MAKYVRGLSYEADCFSYDEKMAKGHANIIKPSKKLILKYLRKRIPVIIPVIIAVIIAVRTSLLRDRDHSNLGHYIVITKYDKGVFWYNDPSSAKKFKIKEGDLMFAWFNNILESTGYMLAIYKTEKLKFISSQY